MIKKTIEQYRKEFSKIYESDNYTVKENFNKYEKLVEECIIDFPDDDTGYIELSEVLYYFVSYLEPEKIKLLVQKTKQNKKYGITLTNFFSHSPVPTYLHQVAEYLEIDKNFAGAWLSLGNAIISDTLECKIAAEYLEKACLSGINYHTFIENLNPKIDKISVKNFLCIKELYIDNLKDKHEIYFLGENGVGKTLLLQAIVLGLIQNDSYNTNELYLSLSFPRDKNKDYIHDIFIDVDKTTNEDKLTYFNVFAYGVGRYRESDNKTEKYGYSTLFDRNELLITPENWFKDVILRQDYKKSQLKIDTVIDFFNSIMNFEANTDFRIMRTGMDISYYEQKTQIEFEHLAEGYRSVLIWLSDLLSRLTENQPYIENLEDFYGVVLVDEVDLFLHPSWEYSIVRKLREKLPNIQWFFTTHSPILILGASDDAVFYKLYKKEGITKISEQWKCSDIDNLLSNALITSPLFEMDTARMKSFANSNKELDTSRDYVESRLRIKIDDKIKQKKDENFEIKRSEIDAIIDNAIDELVNSAKK